METLLLGFLIFAVALLLGGVVALIYQSRKPRSASDVSTTLAIINEKLSHIEPMAQAVGGVQVELRGLTERVSTVEQNQNAVDSNLRSLETGVVKTSVATNSLIEATTAIRNELSRAREGLTELKTHAEARQDVEQRTAESVRRLEAVIAGTQTRGAAGENILEALFANCLPNGKCATSGLGTNSSSLDCGCPITAFFPSTASGQRHISLSR